MRLRGSMVSVVRLPYKEAHKFKNHEDFVPIHMYGSLKDVQTGELGALMKNGIPYKRIVGYGLS